MREFQMLGLLGDALFLPIPVISDVMMNFFLCNCQFHAARPHQHPLGLNRMNRENQPARSVSATEPLDFPTAVQPRCRPAGSAPQRPPGFPVRKGGGSWENALRGLYEINQLGPAGL